ncbi:sigma-70 family RNA polymerase sigma factor [uncultured Alistipes sp.]|jgi:RNA polymerase sigma factor, sigma-70 family|uniref:RNA polymerase sigma factor n=1 Tax=uncultured Alistipes sp. TaxID=538949 RepID=UPI0025FF14BE|nr:sigma-70 family RNA polymerase sigma factor [uncultured Alistipes sp.]
MHDFDTTKDYTREDAELLEKYLQTGDTAWFGALYTRYMPLVYGLCLKYLGRAEDAEDAVMQIFEELVQKIDRYQIKVFRTWLWSVARNHCLQKLRREKQSITVDFGDQFMETAAIVHLLNEGSNEEALSALEKCMEKLPEKQRESIRLFFIEKQSYADIAEATSYNIKGVKSYIQNGKRNLKSCIEQQGIRL